MSDPESKPRDDEIDVFGLTHVGKVRSENQDHFLICSLRKQLEIHSTSLPERGAFPLRGDRLAFLAVVADGVGGQAAGGEASQTALETVVQYVNRAVRCFHTADAEQEEVFLGHLRDSILECQSAVLAKAEGDREGMATTLTALMVVWPRAYVIQVGDSRCYWLHDGELRQITRDQTLAQELIDRGELTRDSAEVIPLGNVLVSAIGAPHALPVLTRINVRRRDVVLLCSDGLTAAVKDDLIRKRLLAMESAEQVCRQLLDDALEAGAPDNVTILVGRARPV